MSQTRTTAKVTDFNCDRHSLLETVQISVLYLTGVQLLETASNQAAVWLELRPQAALELRVPTGEPLILSLGQLSHSGFQLLHTRKGSLANYRLEKKLINDLRWHLYNLTYATY